MIRLILISLLVLLGGCGGGDAEEKRGDLSVIAISEESVVLQPLRGEWPLKPELIAGAVSRGLVKLDGYGQVVPDMATSWGSEERRVGKGCVGSSRTRWSLCL